MMPDHTPATFRKSERLVSRRLIEMLFTKGNSRMLSVFPLRLVYTIVDAEETEAPAQVLISVSKRHFKRAVKRNRVKRQIREAYRRNKHILLDSLAQREGKALVMAFLWQADELAETATVETCVVKLLSRTAEMICRQKAETKTTEDSERVER